MEKTTLRALAVLAIALAFLLGAAGGFLGRATPNRFVATKILFGTAYGVVLTDTTTGRAWLSKFQGEGSTRWTWAEAAPPPAD